jgi:signal transduction histidine kinase
MKILTVDDKVENLYLLESMLRGAGCGYEVVTAQNGVEALQKLDQEKFDLIISDILMPEIDGFELCRRVKEREDLRQIPFIFYTATYTEKKDEELGLRLGASRFIMKPQEPEKFLAIVSRTIQEYEAGQLVAPPAPVEKEEVLLKEYNRRLVRKLDQKVEQLEQAMQKVQASLEEKDREVGERRKAEKEVRRVNAELEERVRERTADLVTAISDLENFVSAASHDLRAPLRAIVGYSQLLARSQGKLDERDRAYLDALHAEGKRMTRLVEGLLQLSRARRAIVRREEVNLSQMAREIERDLRREHPERQVDFQLTLGMMVHGDPVLLRSALRNLLGNAWKFTGKTSQAIVKFGRVEQEGKPVYFVSDNGAGFDMKYVDKLFIPFERLHENDEFPGNGVGLATVQQIIQRHGGKIWAEGEEGKGATFYFTLPS